MRRASSALRVCSERASSSEKTATVRMPSSAAARMMRIAISARLAIRRLFGIMFPSSRFQDTQRLPDLYLKHAQPTGRKCRADRKIWTDEARHNHAGRVECSANERHQYEEARLRDRVGAGRGAVGGFGDEPSGDELSCDDTSARRTRDSD